jgi:hypothetical protein
MENLYQFIIIYFFYRVLKQFIGLKSTLKFLKKRNDNKKEYSHKIIVLIPICCETTATLKKTIQFWKKTNIQIFFITTARETNQEIFLILKSENINYLHSPNRSGFKAVQLNFAIQKILKKKFNGYIAIFDVDSRPDFKMFKNIKYYSAPVLQAPTIFIGKKTAFSFASAIYQTRRVVTFEIPQFLQQKIIYLIGHGLFLHSSILKPKIFNEETLTEDLILGYQLFFKNIRFEILPFFDKALVPENISILTKQTSRWFLGDLLFLKYVDIKAKNVFNIIKRYFHIFDWFFGTVAILLVLFSGNCIEKSLIIFAVILFFTLNILTAKLFNLTLNFKIILNLILRMTLNSLAPIYAILKSKTIEFKTTKK